MLYDFRPIWKGPLVPPLMFWVSFYYSTVALFLFKWHLCFKPSRYYICLNTKRTMSYIPVHSIDDLFFSFLCLPNLCFIFIQFEISPKFLSFLALISEYKFISTFLAISAGVRQKYQEMSVFSNSTMPYLSFEVPCMDRQPASAALVPLEKLLIVVA